MKFANRARTLTENYTFTKQERFLKETIGDLTCQVSIIRRSCYRQQEAYKRMHRKMRRQIRSMKTQRRELVEARARSAALEQLLKHWQPLISRNHNVTEPDQVRRDIVELKSTTGEPSKQVYKKNNLGQL